MEWILHQLGELLANNQFLQGGVIFGLLTGVVYKLKAVPTFIGNKFRYYATYTIHFDEGTEFYRLFVDWLNEAHPTKFRNVEIKFEGERGGEHSEPVPATIPNGDAGTRRFKLRKHQFSDANVIRHKGRWLWITKDRARLDSARDMRSMFYNSYTVSGFFAKTAIEDLCRVIEDRRNAEIDESALKVHFNSNGYFEQTYVNVVKSLDHIFFEDKPKLVADLSKFLEKKDVYAKKGIKYKRSYLFYGPGGTGKTSLGLAIAKYLDYDLYVINLAGMKNDQELANQAPRIGKRSVILLEDIDCVLSKREVKGQKLNFSTVLNFLDGLYAPSDCIFVMTTNKPDKLDAALTRKGRVDLALNVDYPHVPDVEAYMSDFYDAEVKLPLYSGTKAFAGMSSVQDICLQNDLEKAKRLVLAVFIRANGHDVPSRETREAISAEVAS